MKNKTGKTVEFSKKSIIELTNSQLINVVGGTNGGVTGRTGLIVEDAEGF